jgi:hypothetical protein
MENFFKNGIFKKIIAVCLFMDSSGKCNKPSTTLVDGLRALHDKYHIVKICSYGGHHGPFIMKRSKAVSVCLVCIFVVVVFLSGN